MDNYEFDSLFADQMDDETKFDTIFDSDEDGNLVDMVCGFNEAGECETDFEELHQEFDDAEPDEFEDELVGDDTSNAPDDAEGSDEDPAIDLALGEKFEYIHNTEDDAEPDDFEQLLGPETLNGADDPEGTDDEPAVDIAANNESYDDLDLVFGEDFDVIHQTADGACAKTLDDEVTGPETLNGAKNPEGTDEDPAIDLASGTGHKNTEHDETRIDDEFDKLMESDEGDDDFESDDFEPEDDEDSEEDIEEDYYFWESEEDADYDNDSEGEFKGEDYEDSGLVGDDMDYDMDSLSDECNESEIVGPDADESYEYIEDYEDGDESLVDMVAGTTSAD